MRAILLLSRHLLLSPNCPYGCLLNERLAIIDGVELESCALIDRIRFWSLFFIILSLALVHRAPGMYLVFSAINSNGLLDMLTRGRIARHSWKTGLQCRNAVRTRNGRGIQQSSRITQKPHQKVAIKLQLLS